MKFIFGMELQEKNLTHKLKASLVIHHYNLHILILMYQKVARRHLKIGLSFINMEQCVNCDKVRTGRQCSHCGRYSCYKCFVNIECESGAFWYSCKNCYKEYLHDKRTLYNKIRRIYNDIYMGTTGNVLYYQSTRLNSYFHPLALYDQKKHNYQQSVFLSKLLCILFWYVI